LPSSPAWLPMHTRMVLASLGCLQYRMRRVPWGEIAVRQVPMAPPIEAHLSRRKFRGWTFGCGPQFFSAAWFWCYRMLLRLVAVGRRYRVMVEQS
jgi:hypothetical protein